MDGGQKCKSASLNQSKRAVSCDLGAQAAAAAAGYVHCGGAEARNAIRESESNDEKEGVQILALKQTLMLIPSRRW